MSCPKSILSHILLNVQLLLWPVSAKCKQLGNWRLFWLNRPPLGLPTVSTWFCQFCHFECVSAIFLFAFRQGRKKLHMSHVHCQSNILNLSYWLKSHTLTLTIIMTQYPEYWTHRWLLLRLFQNFWVAQGHLKAKVANTSNLKDFNSLHWFSVYLYYLLNMDSPFSDLHVQLFSNRFNSQLWMIMMILMISMSYRDNCLFLCQITCFV